MSVSMGQVLGVIGGSPILKAGKVVIEKLKAAKTTDMGGMKNVLSSVLQSGPGAALQNPMAGGIGNLSGTLSSAMSTLGGAGGGLNLSSLTSAIGGAGGLQSALGSLSSVTNALSGLTGASGTGGAGAQFGLTDLIGHSNLTSSLGSALPSALSFTNAAGPLNIQSLVNSVNTQIPSLVSSVIGGTTTPESAAATVKGYTDSINNTIAASNNAIAAGQTSASDLCNVAVAVTAATSTSMDPQLTAQMQSIVKPGVTAA